MKRSHSLLALGAAVIGLSALASFTAPPRTPVNLLPVPVFTVVVMPSTTSLPLVTPTSIALPSAIPNTPTTIAFATSLAPLPTFATVVTSVSSIASTETAIPTNTESPPIPIPQPSDTPALTSTPLPFTSTPPVPTSTPTATPVPLTEATLIRVIDGDTLEVSFAGRTERVRLIGIDSPEINGPPICFGQEATTHAQQLLAPSGGKIWLEKDITETDQYDRLLRYVWLDPAQTRMFDEAMVADGYAQVSTYPPDVKYESRFLLAQRTAQASSRGLWGACPYFGAPLPTPTSPALPTEPPPPASTPAPQGDLPYDPNGPDRDCSDFATHDEAQRFFIAAGGPANDPHRLDGDHDGIACETLP